MGFMLGKVEGVRLECRFFKGTRVWDVLLNTIKQRIGGMTEETFKDICLCGETTTVQFKEIFTSQKEIAKELIAFANTKGGMILIYRGLGSGIVRAMRENCHIDFDNEESANQFKVTVWRTIQKDDLKDSSTTQKDLDTIQKKVLEYFSAHPHSTIDEAVAAIEDLSLGGVKFIISKLQQKGLLKRVGGRKQGEWKVLVWRIFDHILDYRWTVRFP